MPCSKTLAQLKQMKKYKTIEGRSSMNKEQLCRAMGYWSESGATKKPTTKKSPKGTKPKASAKKPAAKKPAAKKSPKGTKPKAPAAKRATERSNFGQVELMTLDKMKTLKAWTPIINLQQFGEMEPSTGYIEMARYEDGMLHVRSSYADFLYTLDALNQSGDNVARTGSGGDEVYIIRRLASGLSRPKLSDLHKSDNPEIID